MNNTSVYLKGALEPLIFDEPLDVTVLNMSAAQNNSLAFFVMKDRNGLRTAVAINQILYMREGSNADGP